MSKTIEKENANFASKKVHNYSNVGHETNLILSQNIKITYDTWKTHLGCMNVLVIGATGEGKSRNFVRPNLYSLLTDPKNKKPMSFVCTDPKGELYQDSAGFFAANGYEIRVLNLIDMLHSDCYNPFRYFNFSKNPDITLMNFINSLVDASSGGDGNSKDPYWPNMAKNLINSLAFYCYYELPAEYQNLTTVSDMVPLFFKGEKEAEAPIDKLYKTCKNVSMDKHPALKWRNKIKNAQGKELGSILGATNDALRLWADSNIRRLTQFDTLKLDEVGDRPTVLYVITPPDNSTYDFIVGTFYDQLISTLMYKANFIYNKKGLPHHVVLMQDEAANTGKINDYHKKIATWRSANISSIQIVQSTSQFKAMYGDKAQDVIDNAHITIFLGNGGNSVDNNGSAASDFMSRALGKTTVKAESYSLNYDKENIKPNINTSINLSQRELMTPDEVKRINYDECIVLIKGYKPFLDKKIDLNTSLNFASELFSDKEVRKIKDRSGKEIETVNWTLKKQFIYNIEDKLNTLDSFNQGYKECKEIDIMQTKAVKERLITDSQFASFKEEKRQNQLFIDNYQFKGLKDIELYLKSCLISGSFDDDYLIDSFRNRTSGAFIRESILEKNIKNDEKLNATENSENTQIEYNKLASLSQFDIPFEIVNKMYEESKLISKKILRGNKEVAQKYIKEHT